jgi:gamma-glutamyltranspeptidase / glutathione hydrolase
VSPTVARLWARQAPSLKDMPGFAEHFMPHGRPPEVGEKFDAPAHARTLKCIAETKGAAFYRRSGDYLLSYMLARAYARRRINILSL